MKAAPDFNRLAGLYRWMEFFSFGPWLALTRGSFLDELKRCRRALVLGDGDGRFTARLLRANRTVKVDAVDASAAMLQALTRRAGADADRVRVHLADVRIWSAPAQSEAPPYDVVATHFLLDCLTSEEVGALALKVRAQVAADAVWVVSEFAVPEGWFGRMVATPLVGGLYIAFGMLTGLTVRRLPDHAGALGQAGFALADRRRRLGGLLIAELWRGTVPEFPVTPTGVSG